MVKDLKNSKFMYTDRVVNRLKRRPKKQSSLIFSEKDRFVLGITSELLIHLSKVIGQTFYFCQVSQELRIELVLFRSKTDKRIKVRRSYIIIFWWTAAVILRVLCVIHNGTYDNFNLANNVKNG